MRYTNSKYYAGCVIKNVEIGITSDKLEVQKCYKNTRIIRNLSTMILLRFILISSKTPEIFNWFHWFHTFADHSINSSIAVFIYILN